MSARLQETSVAEQAAQWVVDFDDTTHPVALDRFAAWLKASPQNVEAYLSAAAAWETFNGADSLCGIDVRRMVQEAQANVVSLQGSVDEPVTPRTPSLPSPARGRGKWWTSAAAALAAITAGALLLVFGPGRAQIYSTDKGEQRTVKLADGSIVYLNTYSKLRVQYSVAAREVRLLRGEALFAVEKDPARPFRVDAGKAVVQAIGTQFNVNRQADGIKVSVIEGAVRVTASEGTRIKTPPGRQPTRTDRHELKAGEEARIAANGAISRLAVTNIVDAVAWRERRLVFRDDTLADIVAEFNRYNNDYRLRLVNKTAGALRLTGVFRADDPQTLLLFLKANSKLAVEKDAAGALIR